MDGLVGDPDSSEARKDVLAAPGILDTDGKSASHRLRHRSERLGSLRNLEIRRTDDTSGSAEPLKNRKPVFELPEGHEKPPFRDRCVL